MLLFDLRSLYNPEELSRVEHSCCIRKPADKSRFATCCSRLNPLNTIQDGWKYRSTANQPDGRWRSGIGRLGRTSQITFQLQQSETRLKFLSKPHVEAKEGHLCDSRCHLSLSVFHPAMLRFNGLCRKSMWDRLHRGRKRVWSSTNKHRGQTAAAP